MAPKHRNVGLRGDNNDQSRIEPEQEDGSVSGQSDGGEADDDLIEGGSDQQTTEERLEEDLTVLRSVMHKVGAESGKGAQGSLLSDKEMTRILRRRAANLDEYQRKRGGISLMRKLDLLFLVAFFITIWLWVKLKYDVNLIDVLLLWIKPRRIE